MIRRLGSRTFSLIRMYLILDREKHVRVRSKNSLTYEFSRLRHLDRPSEIRCYQNKTYIARRFK